MRLALIQHRRRTVNLEATGEPPRDRTSRVEKAMTQCREAWSAAFDLATVKGYTTPKASRMAAVAYKLAMPALDSVPAIRAAIACIAQGINLEVYDGRDGSQLLYAAQVALSIQNKRAKK